MQPRSFIGSFSEKENICHIFSYLRSVFEPAVNGYVDAAHHADRHHELADCGHDLVDDLGLAPPRVLADQDVLEVQLVGKMHQRLHLKRVSGLMLIGRIF